MKDESPIFFFSYSVVIFLTDQPQNRKRRNQILTFSLLLSHTRGSAAGGIAAFLLAAFRISRTFPQIERQSRMNLKPKTANCKSHSGEARLAGPPPSRPQRHVQQNSQKQILNMEFAVSTVTLAKS